jgi:cell wall-associated NlpC family hydrolase
MKKFIIIFGCLLLVKSNLIGDVQKMIVHVPVADLRSKPEPVPQGLQGPAMSQDIGAQDSQVSFAESILGEDLPDNPEWVKVTVLGQKDWRDQKWVGYPGFILKSYLTPVTEFPKYNIVLQKLWTPLFSSMDEKNPCNFLALGTRLEAQKIDNWWKVTADEKVLGYLKASDGIFELTPAVINTKDELREKIVQIAYLFLSSHTPYVWGGKSPLREGLTTQITGIDCSGLTQACYLAWGFEIPRDSARQYRAATPLACGKDLKKADLIFFAKTDGPQIPHVVMYIGDGYVIESTGMGVSSLAQAIEKGISVEALSVKKTEVKELIGVEVDEIESGKTIAKNGRRVLLGSFFEPDDKLEVLRSVAIGQRSTF